jgi:hypothetical protein
MPTRERLLALRARTQAELDAAVPTSKRCRVCLEEKPGVEFTQDRNKPDGRDTKCKDCSAEESRRYRVEHSDRVRISKTKSYLRNYTDTTRPYRLKRHYGLTVAEYDAMLLQQDGKCAICRQPETSRSRNGESIKLLAVDHDHVSGAPRALLCAFCNQGIGSFKDDPVRLRAAADYIERHF